jgi:hypothetical protein
MGVPGREGSVATDGGPGLSVRNGNSKGAVRSGTGRRGGEGHGVGASERGGVDENET